MATKRRRFTAEFKAKVVMEALRGDRTIQAIAAKHEVHPNQISGWKRQAQTGLRQLVIDRRPFRMSVMRPDGTPRSSANLLALRRRDSSSRLSNPPGCEIGSIFVTSLVEATHSTPQILLRLLSRPSFHLAERGMQAGSAPSTLFSYSQRTLEPELPHKSVPVALPLPSATLHPN